jgi:hypothetical protein
MFMETNLRVASIFATRWATHESRDFSQTRFEEFNSILLKELPGYYAVGLIPPDLKAGWLVSRDASISQFVLPDEYHALLEQARRSNRAVLSPPFEFQKNAAAVYAVLPLRRGNELLGYLVVNLSAEDLINDCFHLGIRSSGGNRIPCRTAWGPAGSAQKLLGNVEDTRNVERSRAHVEPQ